MKVALSLAGVPLEKFEESKVERDERGRFADKAVGVLDAAVGGLALSQIARGALILARARAGRIGTAVTVRPSDTRLALAAIRRHAIPVIAAGTLGAVYGDSAAGQAATALRGVGAVAGGAGLGEIAGTVAQLAVVAATKGRLRVPMLPKVGGVIGGAFAAAQALDLTSRFRRDDT